MARSTSFDELAELERLIRVEPDLKYARGALRNFLFLRAGANTPDGSIADALAELVRNGSPDPEVAVVLLRCLAVPGLVPQPSSANQLARSAVELCEISVPDIISFLKIDKKSQNYEKFLSLQTAHQKITEILRPFKSSYGDLDALLSARREIAGCLNHSIIRQYGAPFRLADVRNAIEAIFHRLKKVSALETSLLIDIEECTRSINNAKSQLCQPIRSLASISWLPF